jgi:hypothetical protein
MVRAIGNRSGLNVGVVPMAIRVPRPLASGCEVFDPGRRLRELSHDDLAQPCATWEQMWQDGSALERQPPWAAVHGDVQW